MDPGSTPDVATCCNSAQYIVGTPIQNPAFSRRNVSSTDAEPAVEARVHLARLGRRMKERQGDDRDVLLEAAAHRGEEHVARRRGVEQHVLVRQLSPFRVAGRT